jgi:hypothetical protein
MPSPKKTTRKRRARPYAPYTHKVYRPYVQAIGQAVLAWNQLHEQLAMLFCHAMGGGISNQYLAVWHALTADRAQRDILLAALKTMPQLDYSQPHRRFWDDVGWLCIQTMKLEDDRNNTVHAPIYGYSAGIGTGMVFPGTGLGHVRATKLAKETDLLRAYRRYRDIADILTGYAEDLDGAFSGTRKTWPDRPKLPKRMDPSAKKPRPPTPPKGQPHPPRSSPA